MSILFACARASVCVCVCVCACVRACVRVCVTVCIIWVRNSFDVGGYRQVCVE